MKIFKIIILLAVSFLTISCELIVIGTPPQDVKPIIVDRNSPEGTALLFKAELDTNNISSAAELLDSEYKSLRAIDRYDKYYDLISLANTIYNREVTKVASDTIGKKQVQILIELSYTRNLTLLTFFKDSTWYISDYTVE